MKNALLVCASILCLCAAFAAVEAGFFFLSTSAKTSATLNDVDATVKHFDTAFAPVLDCVQTDAAGKKHGNPACLPSQILATVGSVKAMASAGAKAAPLVVKDFELIAGSMTKSSDNVEKLTSNLSTAAKDADAQVRLVGTTVVGLRTDLAPTLTTVAGLAADTRADLATLQPSIQKSLSNISDASGNISVASKNFSNLVPVIQSQIVNIGGSIQQTTDHIATLTKPHWYDRLLGYTFTALGMYRAINPAMPNISLFSTTQRATQK